MGLATYKDLVIDAGDAARLGRFWADLLGRRFRRQRGGDAEIRGTTPQDMIWVNQVAEPKTVKHRIHLDVFVRSLADAEALGATVVRAQGDDRTWTVMADVEGGEFCAFLKDVPPDDRLPGLVIDSADPVAQAEWWANVLDGTVTHHLPGWSAVGEVADMPIGTFDFVEVAEHKTVKNRIHWDVVGAVEPLVEAGATVLRAAGGGLGWSVLADPEGNGFCVFRPR
jgi:Glyoxalase-like domain